MGKITADPCGGRKQGRGTILYVEVTSYLCFESKKMTDPYNYQERKKIEVDAKLEVDTDQ